MFVEISFLAPEMDKQLGDAKRSCFLEVVSNKEYSLLW